VPATKPVLLLVPAIIGVAFSVNKAFFFAFYVEKHSTHYLNYWYLKSKLLNLLKMSLFLTQHLKIPISKL
jgi:hypothetical protein